MKPKTVSCSSEGLDHRTAETLGRAAFGFPMDAEEAVSSGQDGVAPLGRFAGRDLQVRLLLPDGAIPEVGDSEPPLQRPGMLRVIEGPQSEPKALGLGSVKMLPVTSVSTPASNSARG